MEQEIMKCVAIDDEPLALDLIRKYASQYPFLDMVATFDDAVEGSEFLKKTDIDLLFVDINMPDVTGLELVASLISRPMVIFTTAHKKFAHEGFELDALDYLLKPITPERFEKAVNKANRELSFQRPSRDNVSEAIFVRSEYKVVKIELDDIEFIEAMEDYIKIHLFTTTHPVLTLMSLKGILKMLPETQFSRIHRSYIIPDARVKSIQNKKVLLNSNKELPVSDTYLGFITRWKNR